MEKEENKNIWVSERVKSVDPVEALIESLSRYYCGRCGKTTYFPWPYCQYCGHKHYEGTYNNEVARMIFNNNQDVTGTMKGTIDYIIYKLENDRVITKQDLDFLKRIYALAEEIEREM